MSLKKFFKKALRKRYLMYFGFKSNIGDDNLCKQNSFNVIQIN